MSKGFEGFEGFTGSDGFNNFEYESLLEQLDIKRIETGLDGVVLWHVSDSLPLVDLALLPEDISETHIDFPRIGDREVDGLMWSYCENLDQAAYLVFSETLEQLTGEGLEPNGPLSEYTDCLMGRCLVITSELPDGKEPAVRTLNCLSEKGCVIAAVSDAKWRTLMGLDTEPFWDSGIRVMQFTGCGPEGIYLNDPMNPSGRQNLLTFDNLSKLQGILMEVYK